MNLALLFTHRASNKGVVVPNVRMSPIKDIISKIVIINQ